MYSICIAKTVYYAASPAASLFVKICQKAERYSDILNAGQAAKLPQVETRRVCKLYYWGESC